MKTKNIIDILMLLLNLDVAVNIRLNINKTDIAIWKVSLKNNSNTPSVHQGIGTKIDSEQSQG